MRQRQRPLTTFSLCLYLFSLSPYPFSAIALQTFAGDIGQSVMRTPAAAKIAFAIAGFRKEHLVEMSEVDLLAFDNGGEGFPAAVLEFLGQARAATPAATTTTAAKDRLLVFSKTGGFRHQSIPDGIKAIQKLLGDRYDIEASEDSAVFTADNLKRFRAVIFLSTTGDILNDDQQKAFEGYIKSGGGYAGVHAAADTEHTWPWYADLVGALFKTHPPTQPALVKVEDRSHRSTRMLPAEWRRTDEWYVYDRNPRERVKILATVDDSTIKGATMGSDHPIAFVEVELTQTHIVPT